MIQTPAHNLSSYKITILYNQVKSISIGSPQDILADDDTVKTAHAIFKTLQKEKLNVELLEVNEKNYTDLLTYKTDFFFNLCYGIGSIPKTEQEIPKLLEKIALPYTGASDKSIILTTDKIATKKLFQKFKIPTPAYEVFTPQDKVINGHLKYPLIVKPGYQDCSLGIHSDAVITNESQLQHKVLQLLQQYREPVLVEKFINTRELNVTIVGNGKDAIMLPISEIIFGPTFEKKGKWKIVDFEAKWIEESENYNETVGICPAKLDNEIIKKIKKYALEAYNSSGCRDYARIDIRLDEKNKPYFLEINVNPGIGPEDGAVRSAKTAGFSYPQFLKKLIEIAIIRARTGVRTGSDLKYFKV